MHESINVVRWVHAPCVRQGTVETAVHAHGLAARARHAHSVAGYIPRLIATSNERNEAAGRLLVGSTHLVVGILWRRVSGRGRDVLRVFLLHLLIRGWYSRYLYLSRRGQTLHANIMRIAVRGCAQGRRAMLLLLDLDEFLAPALPLAAALTHRVTTRFV